MEPIFGENPDRFVIFFIKTARDPVDKIFY
jgi:hypothetical protein